ncbi:hypothetical protein NUU61_004546 [Penicillium alfredii]|uniref:Uncharacterized protein n=1 Tax=Penicillium alfredii TaxID=1506179 RepID=A0A9W9FLA6_9EURO|nr:uncharacterized protein NUU61_004546 [Penicillium alfredii]KAJ5102324.1 hypothetical protein NUU61_004546 [Penicillium alfredii]
MSITSEPYFQGWFVEPSTTRAIICPTTQVFSISDGIGDCLEKDATAVATGCAAPHDGATLFYGNGGSHKCASDRTCRTMIIPHTSPHGSPVFTHYMCVTSGWSYSTLYRVHPTESGSNSGTTETVTSPPSTSASSTTDSSSSSSATGTGSGGGGSSGGGSSLSGGAIAGIVIGCVAAVVIVVLLLFRKKIIACLGGGRKPQPVDAPTELPSHTAPVHEIGTSGSVVHEIGSSQVGASPVTKPESPRR